MARKERKGYHQKLKMLYLAKIFSEETDSGHSMTMAQIIARLAECGVNADRKTLYLDFEELRDFGIDIAVRQEGRSHFYYQRNRQPALPDLKLLADAVQTSPYVTEKKSRELARVLGSLTSRYEAMELERQIFLAGRIRTMNESIYFDLDKIQDAIREDRQIRFRYFRWNSRKEPELDRGGSWYQVSPWALAEADGYHYLIAYDEKEDRITHFRIDKMLKVSATETERLGRDCFLQTDLAQYINQLCRTDEAEPVAVTLEADERMADLLIDRFGMEIPIQPAREGYFRTQVLVPLTADFLGWVIGLGEGVTVVAPDSAVEKIRTEARQLAARYAER